MKEIERYVYEEDGMSYPNPNARRQQGYREGGGDAQQRYSEDDVRMPRPRERLPPSDQYQYTESMNRGYDDDSYQRDDQGRYNDDDERSRPPPPRASARDPQRRTDQFGGSDYEEYNNRDDRYAAARGRQKRDYDDDYPPQRRPRVDYSMMMMIHELCTLDNNGHELITTMMMIRTHHNDGREQITTMMMIHALRTDHNDDQDLIYTMIMRLLAGVEDVHSVREILIIYL